MPAGAGARGPPKAPRSIRAVPPDAAGVEPARPAPEMTKSYTPHGVLVNAISQIVQEFSAQEVGQFVVTVRIQIGYNTTEVSVSSADAKRASVTS
jgi:hypothetical protein